MSKTKNYIIDYIKEFLTTKAWIYIVLILVLYFLYKTILTQGVVYSFGLSFFPISLAIIILLFIYPEKGFYPLFASHFIILIISRNINMPLGGFILLFNFIILLLILIYSIYKKTNWKNSRNLMLLLYCIWGIFCILEILNPNNVQEAWNIAFSQYVVYPVLCAILIPISIKKTNNINWLLIIWSMFILYASFKGYWQKNHGFNERELYFLFVEGGEKTHIIWSGIRYFSVFTDAANFGVHMGMAIVVFGISTFYIKQRWLKIYFVFVIAVAVYSMFISGTRAAIAVPVTGIAFFTILSRNMKSTIVGLFVLISFLIFFMFTTIGDSNRYIHRMRSAFTPTNDASYQVRQINQQKMKLLMNEKPFGYGIGLGKGERFHPKELMPFPPDSWLVNVWVESGVVGLSLYILIHCILFAWCSWIIMFKIMNKRLRGILTAWLSLCAGFFVAAYANDVMQYPNSIVFYSGFALCIIGPLLDKEIDFPQIT